MARKKAKTHEYVGSLVWILDLLPAEQESLLKYLQTISELKKIPDSQREKITTVLIPLLKSGKTPNNPPFIQAMDRCKLNPVSAAREIGIYYKFRENSRKA